MRFTMHGPMYIKRSKYPQLQSMHAWKYHIIDCRNFSNVPKRLQMVLEAAEMR